MRILATCVILLLAAAFALVYASGSGMLGSHEEPGEVTRAAIPAAIVTERSEAALAASRAAGVGDPKQILFGDLHVHTTLSADAYLLSLPMLQGEGAHPPADACDFARYCSALDFWSINDHAEALTPRHWQETVESIRQCNAVTEGAGAPDVVAFLGWEWTQVGNIPTQHYGHKNVVLAHTDDARIPARPIASRGLSANVLSSGPGALGLGLFALRMGGGRYFDYARYAQERRELLECPDGVPVRDLPRDCLESTTTPGELFAKLRDWGHDSIVIPHGTTWGFYTPAGSSWDKQLSADQHDPERQTLIEVYSGHGNSEEYREFRAVRFGRNGEAICPEPTPDYLPSCWRAGEIIRQRCLAAALGVEECERRAVEARGFYLGGGQSGYLTVSGATTADWLDSGQCRDCFLPSFNYRPMSSVQYITALRNPKEPEATQRFRFGFMASSDNHKARPGTGFKELDRQEMTEATGPGSADRNPLFVEPREPLARADRYSDISANVSGFGRLEAERQASYFTTGGLIATHAEGRSREAIWGAMRRKEVYGTSGPRILLWFDLLNAPGGRAPMGSDVDMSAEPSFEVRAVGSYEQKPGCPEYSTTALSAERLHHLCRDECYNPSDKRRVITRIEVVRVRPQKKAGEDVGPLIEDPWKVLPCSGNPSGCVARFSDPAHAQDRRDTVYYVRAIEEPSAAVNAGGLRCERDAEGNCIRVRPCYGDFRTEFEDDCLEQTEERAWSSPIFVDWGRDS